jgi:hypothetical protein
MSSWRATMTGGKMENFNWTPIVWPTAALLGAIAFMAIFKKPISDAIDRIRRIGRDGADLAPNQKSPAEQQKSADAATAQTDAPALPVAASQALPPPNEVFAPIERQIQGALAQANASDEVNRAWLIRALATSRQMLAHERVYRLILASQLHIILEANTGIPVDLSRAREVYERAREQFTDMYAGFDFENWSSFPINQGLLQREALPEGRIVLRITPTGTDFLHYLVQFGLTGQKLG